MILRCRLSNKVHNYQSKMVGLEESFIQMVWHDAGMYPNWQFDHILIYLRTAAKKIMTKFII